VSINLSSLARRCLQEGQKLYFCPPASLFPLSHSPSINCEQEAAFGSVLISACPCVLQFHITQSFAKDGKHNLKQGPTESFHLLIQFAMIDKFPGILFQRNPCCQFQPPPWLQNGVKDRLHLTKVQNAFSLKFSSVGSG
jgi:hypothetical protein